MKYVKTFESYITYDKLGKWGKYSNESEIEDDLRMTLIRLFQYGGISNYINDLIYTDQSSDKGIKWQIEVKGKGSDLIHAYKDGKFKGQYEWYLNKKKSSKYDIQQYFINKYLSDLDAFLAAAKGYDYYAAYIDNGTQYKNVVASNKKIEDIFNSLSSSDKKAAIKSLKKEKQSEEALKVFKV